MKFFSQSRSLPPQHRVLLVIGILLIATTLRAPFTAAAPLLDNIGHTLALSTAETGFLTTLPLLAFAVVSPFAAGIARRAGTERTLLAALIIICLGIVIRSAGHHAALYIGTAVLGCGIAIGNVLLPSLIKQDFSSSIARLTGAYSLVMGIAAALGSTLVIPLSNGGAGWKGALLSLLIFPVIALLIWIPSVRHRATNPPEKRVAAPVRGLWRASLAWYITLYLGINSFLYYVIIGWLPSILISYGYNAQLAGSIHGLLQLATAVPGLFIGWMINRMTDQKAIAIMMALMWLLCLVGLLMLPRLAPVWICLGGFGSGAAMILGLSFIALRTRSAPQAAALSGMAQSIGYLLAACGPPMIGKLHDISGGWSIPLVLLTAGAMLMTLFGALAGRPVSVDVPEKASMP